MPELLFEARIPLLGARDLGESRAALEQAAGSLVTARLQTLSSGGYSSASLAAMGHPYATRNPRPPAPAYLVNAQSGRFRAGWQVQARMSGDRLTVTAGNSAPYARYLFGGTSRMIARPLLDRARAELRQWLGRFLAGAAKRGR